MPRNPLTRSPRKSEPEDFVGKSYKFSIWLNIFPDQGVEVHVGVEHIDPGVTIDLTVSPTLMGISQGSRKENKATSAELTISNSHIRFSNIPQISKTAGFSSCGHCQIEDIDNVTFDCRGFKLRS